MAIALPDYSTEPLGLRLVVAEYACGAKRPKGDCGVRSLRHGGWNLV